MNIQQTDFEGLLVLEPSVWKDQRGYFFETFQKKRYAEAGIHVDFVQDNEAFSSRGALRGLHYQIPPFAQAKLVRVVQGEVLDVVVDIRTGSPTYGKHYSILLNNKNKKQLFVPHGFAHGYLTLTETAIFAYKCDQYYSKEHEGGIRFDDPALQIDWNFNIAELLVSAKDMDQPTLGNHKPWPAI